MGKLGVAPKLESETTYTVKASGKTEKDAVLALQVDLGVKHMDDIGASLGLKTK
jgi:hypothetical protein